jgi:hypothetical protein
MAQAGDRTKAGLHDGAGLAPNAIDGSLAASSEMAQRSIVSKSHGRINLFFHVSVL